MRQPESPTPSPDATARLRRRGIVALAAGALAKLSPGAAHAADSANLVVGAQNSAASTTTLDRNSADPNRVALLVQNNNFDAIQGVASGSLAYGVFGENAVGIGMAGTSNTGTGVSGASAGGVGVVGDSAGGCLSVAMSQNLGAAVGRAANNRPWSRLHVWSTSTTS